MTTQQTEQPQAAPSQTPAANSNLQTEGAGSSPAPQSASTPSSIVFTREEHEALLAEEVKKATEPLHAEIKKAKSLTADEKVYSTLKEAYKVGHNMPDEIADVVARIVKQDEREKFVEVWKKNTVNPALESAKEKLKTAATEPHVNIGNGGGANTKQPVTAENIDALWLAAELTGGPNPYEQEYRKFRSNGYRL